ncbi:MAG: TIGR00295 family protein [Candidatus Hadarchaeales archaeon]
MERKHLTRALRKAGCPVEVIEHCKAVERLANRIADEIAENGHEVDRALVSMGALVHDIGRSETHGIEHGVTGAKILREMGLGSLSSFAERHIGAGIPAEEAEALGLKRKDYIPTTIEEKIVAYADKLVDGKRVVSYEKVLERFREELGPDHPAIERLKRLHGEIEELRSGKRSP